MNVNNLYDLPFSVKIFIVSYLVLIGVGLLLSLWVVVESPVLKGTKVEEQYAPEALADIKSAMFYENLKKAHVHHLGHIFMVFSIMGIYAFTRVKDNIKIQVIVWMTIATLVHTLAFLIYSRILLVVFGSVYGVIMVYMMLVILIDCFKPAKSQ